MPAWPATKIFELRSIRIRYSGQSKIHPLSEVFLSGYVQGLPVPFRSPIDSTNTSVPNSVFPSLSKGQVVVSVDSRYFRPTEVDLLIGDATKANQVLGWQPTTTLEQLCQMMVAADVRRNNTGFSF